MISFFKVNWVICNRPQFGTFEWVKFVDVSAFHSVGDDCIFFLKTLVKKIINLLKTLENTSTRFPVTKGGIMILVTAL